MEDQRGADGAAAVDGARAGGASERGGAPRRGGGSGARLSEADWAEARRLYETSDMSTAAIRRMFGLTQWALRRRREIEGWRVRDPAAAPAAARRSPSPLQRLRQQLLALAALLVERLAEIVAAGGDVFASAAAFAAVTEALPNLEARRQAMTKGEREKQAGEPAKREAARREKKNNDARADATRDPAWLRAELKRRLDILRKASES